ncbi:MAG: UDP-N-acetylmuramoyl-tripeptide--D-alanyl-D-alanine ligase [Aquisalimonadaceae bacterium]
MIRASLSELAVALDARLTGEAVIAGLATDTRTLQGGELFVALRGPNFDGHDFLDIALQTGAAAVLAERAPSSGAALVVRDSRHALGVLARYWRRRMAPQMVAVTGSNGKTTVKQMLASILSCAGSTLATEGNLNNDIGVPLTLARLSPEHRYAVIEMGANHAGEIAWLGELAEPNVAVVTNAGPAHLEGFRSLEGVARAKGELFQLLGPDGVAVINADDPFAPLWYGLAENRRVMDFGTSRTARVNADGVDADSRVAIRTPAGSCQVTLPVPGRHNLMNALAATAAAVAVGIPLAHVRTGLEAFRPVGGRLQMARSAEGALIINDTYNANPASLSAGVDVLIEQAQGAGQQPPCKPWLVLGDMAELGVEAEVLHAEAGRLARERGVQRLYTLGSVSEAASRAFGAGASHFTDREVLIAALREDLRGDVAVLVKGSRSMGMEAVVASLMASASASGGH